MILNTVNSNKNIRIYIFSLAVILFFFIALVLSGVAMFFHYENTVKETKKYEQNQILAEYTKIVLDWLTTNRTEIATISDDARIKSMEKNVTIQVLDVFSKQHPDYDLIILLGKDGKSLASSDEKERDFSARPFFKQCLSGVSVVFGPLLSKDTGKVNIGFASPIKVDNSVAGVIIGFSPIDFLKKNLSQSASGSSGEVYLVDPNGYLITPSRFEADLKQKGLIKKSSVLELNIQSYAAQQIRNGLNGTSEYRNYLGNPVLGSYMRFSEPDLGLIVEQNTDETYKEIETGSVYLMLFILILSLLSLTLVIATTIRFVKNKK